MDYGSLRESYPATVSMDQLYRICHISKRKARWLLEQGIIPCVDSGKKTRRFSIQLEDVIIFLERRDAGLLEDAIPRGAFSGGSRPVCPARRALDEKKTHDTWQQGLLQIFLAVRENKPFILNVYRCVHREQVERYLLPLVDDLVMGVLNEESEGITVREEDKAFIAQVYSYILVGLMLDWIKNDMHQEPEELVERLGRLIDGTMERALQRFRIEVAEN